jgi:tetratricopeptide (TPR) repeat protein
MRRSVLAALAASVLWVFFPGARPAPAGEDPAASAYLAGDLPRAEKLLKAEIAAGGARPSRYLFLGRVLFRQQKWPEAEKTLRALLEKDPESPHGRELLGRVLFRLTRFEEAVPYYEEALGQAPRAELRLEFGETLIALERRTEALEQLTRVTRDKRAWPRAHYLLGSLRLESGLGHWAARQLWIAHRLGYRAEDLHLKLARAFYLEGRITGPLFPAGPFAAKEAGERSEKHVLVRPAPLVGEGFWYAAGEDSALYQVEAAVAGGAGKAPDAVLLLCAQCWSAAGNLERAGHYAGSIAERSAELFRVRAEIALLGQDFDAFWKLLAGWPAGKLPGPREAVRYLVRAALLAQVEADLSSALEALEKADGLAPGRSEVLRPMIDVLAQLGRRKEAVEKARLLAELHPDSPEVRLIASRYGIDLEDLERRGAPALEEGARGREEL